MVALFDFLKRKDEVKKAKLAKKPIKASATPVVKKEKKEEEKAKPKVQVSKPKSKSSDFSYDIIKEPHISEKSTDLTAINQYVFRIQNGANKFEIKKAIEGIYGVNVLSVNIVKIPPKKRRLGKTQGFKKGFVKAIIKIKDGQKIEII